MNKHKNIFRPDWATILQGVYSNIAYWLLGLAVLAFWWLVSNFDLLGFKKIMKPAFAIFLYLLTASGAGLFLYWSGRIFVSLRRFTHRKQQMDKPSLNENNNISLTVFDYPWTEHQLSIGGRGFVNFLKVGLRVTNNSESKIHCALRMMDVKYNGKGIVWNWNDGEEWVDAPDPIERKFIKWDEGYNEIEGKIDIAPNGGIGSLLFAESNPYSMEFWFWYVDGKAKNHQVLEGKYKVFVQLEGDCEKNGIKSGFRPLQYEVEFTYKRRKLENVRVSKPAT